MKSDAPVKNARLLVPLPVTCSVELNTAVLSKFKDDIIATRVKSDPLIISFGHRKFDKTGHYQHTHQHIAKKLRELARLLIALTKKDCSIKSISDCLSPKHWETVIFAVKYIAGFNNATKTFLKPTLALKIGHSLKKCAKMCMNTALKTGDKALNEAANGFLLLYGEEWKDRITSQALESLALAKYNHVKYLPLVEDVVKLTKYIDTEIEKVLQANITKEEIISRLSCLCLTQIILFNRKRSGETQRLKKESYLNALKQPSFVDDDVKKSLSKFEQQLCENHVRIETRGKRGRKVAILLTRKMKSNLDRLMAMQSEIGLTTEYLFQKPNTSFPIRGTCALRQLADEAELKHANRITSTTLRKQLATMSQVLGLSETSQDILAQFMGHDIRIHRDFYRLPQSTLEVAKVSKVLHALNSGTMGAVAGKDLDEINAMDPIEIEPCSDDDEEDEPDDSISFEEPSYSKNCTDSDSESELEYTPVAKKKKLGHTIHPKQPVKKTPWSAEEKKAVETDLNKFFRLQKLPGKLDCERVIKKHPVLKTRTWIMVKGYVRNTLAARNRCLRTKQSQD